MSTNERRKLPRGLISVFALFLLLAAGTAWAVIEADTIPPTLSAPVQNIVKGKLGATVPIRLKWSGSDSSGIESYQLWRSTNGGQFVRDTTLPVTATSRTYSLTVGNSYRFRVRAYDNAGNASTRYGPTFRPGVADDRCFCITYLARGPHWVRESSSQAYLGTLTKKLSSARGSAHYAFTARDVAYVASLGSDLGSASVYIDGLLYATAHLHSSSSDAAQIVVSKHWPTLDTHTIDVTAYYGPVITVDAFVTNK